MKTASLFCLGIFIFAALLGLLQLWFSPMEWEVFTKLMLTLGVLFVIVLSVALVRREYMEDKKLKDEGYID